MITIRKNEKNLQTKHYITKADNFKMVVEY